MHKIGLVSISFRGHTPEEIFAAAADAGIDCIEWGSDVHAPCMDILRLEQIAWLQEEYGIDCCSYGTYFRLGITPMGELPDYIRAAKTLGTRVLRLWCGDRKASDCTVQARENLFAQCVEAARVAEREGVVLCLECHQGTYTETAEGALELMQAVDSAAFRMYWQPNQFRTPEENVAYLRKLRPYITNLHVFQWKGGARFPLDAGMEEWTAYLRELPGGHHLLLEFMPDDDIHSLGRETATLRKLTGGSI